MLPHIDSATRRFGLVRSGLARGLHPAALQNPFRRGSATY